MADEQKPKPPARRKKRTAPKAAAKGETKAATKPGAKAGTKAAAKAEAPSKASSSGTSGKSDSGKADAAATEKSAASLFSLDKWLGGFLLALGFLTRLPAPVDEATAKRPLADASWAFPLIGLGVGALGGGILALLHSWNLPPFGAALLALAAMTALTGALHEDGLADCADGLWSGADAKKRLAIMRDSRIGAFGVIALIFVIGLKAAAIGKLAGFGGSWAAALAIVAAASASRGALPVVMYLLPLASDKGNAAEAGKPKLEEAIAAGGLGLLACFLCLGFEGALLALIFAGTASAIFVWSARQRLGGYNGDVLGALQQIAETGTLLVAAATL
jgi:adenosylcobinamide-GDP ribazoletransferase